MKGIFLVGCPVLLLFLMVAVVFPGTADRPVLTVHEWGTFTSIAGEDGLPVSWRTYGGRQDLPCFVNTFGGVKSTLSGTVRMETPVLYFYGLRESVADVKVLFPKGTITEWYPHQSGPRSNSLTSVEWRNIRISPETEPDFPTGSGASHYYAARETDAAQLQVGSEKEKFLFYRGVGTFPLPLAAKATQDGKVLVRNLTSTGVNGVMLFENRGDKLRYLFAGSVHDEIALDRESLQSNWAGLLMDFERSLIDAGLYQKEARAMIETWRDSWFEEGTRLFYIVPKQAVDSILPLSVQPPPAETVRVFVGRMEIITPEIQEDVRQALARNDSSTLKKYGRFIEAIAKRVGANTAFLDSTSDWTRAATCNK